MVNELNQTPKALRIHIGVFGAANAGKSTLVNLVSGQEIALTSDVAGTTTDPVFKPMEINPLGPVVFIDTAGLDDNSELGELRVRKSMSQLDVCDAVIFVVDTDEKNISHAKENLMKISEKKIPVIIIENLRGGSPKLDFSDFAFPKINADLHDKSSAELIRNALVSVLSDRIEEPVLTGNIVKNGDVVILVMPQDIQAPKGRLILPEVQVTRDLLDNGCVVVSATADNLKQSLEIMKNPPALVITDSQIFRMVNEILPKSIPLTSFSMLMAKVKGDIAEFIEGAREIDRLCDGDKVAVIESCSHHPLDGDIARVKIPALLRKYTGKNLDIVNLSGQNISEDLSQFNLAIHCGGCMVNRKAMLSKQDYFSRIDVPMTNFGVAIAYMNGMLDRVCY